MTALTNHGIGEKIATVLREAFAQLPEALRPQECTDDDGRNAFAASRPGLYLDLTLDADQTVSLFAEISFANVLALLRQSGNASAGGGAEVQAGEDEVAEAIALLGVGCPLDDLPECDVKGIDQGDVREFAQAVLAKFTVLRTRPASTAAEHGNDGTLPFQSGAGSERMVAGGGFIVGDGTGEKWRTWIDGFPDWTTDRGKAIRYLRREDAEMAHEEDIDAWSIQPFGESAVGQRSDQEALAREVEALTRRCGELAALIRRMARHVPEEKQVRSQAIDYLNRHGLGGSIFRDNLRAASLLKDRTDG